MYLEKEEVSLYYEVRGKGEPLLLIHGAIVDADLYHEAAELLAAYYTVVTFDRRGNSRSVCKGERTFSMEEQIEDIRDLLDELHIESTYIVGASAGAVIGQCFLQTYPRRVKHLIMYEPAMLGKMMEEPAVRQWVEEMQSLIQERKYSSAVLKFAKHMGPADVRSPGKDTAVFFREMGNHEYTLTQELPALVTYCPDMETMKATANKITIGAGEKSGNTVYARAAVKLAGDIGQTPVFYPGSHNLPRDLPREFAICVLGTLMLAVQDCV